MNVSASIGIIKNATTKNASLKYVLRTIPDVSILLGKRKQDILNRIDEEQAEYKFQTKAISLSDYFSLKTTYSKDLAEIATKHNKYISKYDLLKLYKIPGTYNHHQFEFLLLQKLTELMGDLNLEEIIECLENLKVYEKRVTAFQFETLSERILELTHLISTNSLVRIAYQFGKFDAGTDQLWETLAKIFLFRLEDFEKSEVLQAVKGFAGANRGSDEFWVKVALTYLSKCSTNFTEKEDIELTWILMKIEVKSPEFWLHLNRNFERILQETRADSSNNRNDSFYRFFKYSIANILQISKVNQIELVTALIEERERFDQIKSIKLLKLLAKHKMVSQAIVDAFGQESTRFLPSSSDNGF